MHLRDVRDRVDIPALPTDLHQAVRVVDGRHHDPAVGQEGEEELLFVLRTPRADVDAVVAAAADGRRDIDVEAVAEDERHAFAGDGGQAGLPRRTPRENAVEPALAALL